MTHYKLANWITYSKYGDDSYLLKNNLNAEKIIVSQRGLDILLKLDGKTDPSTLVKDYEYSKLSDFINRLVEGGMLRKSRFVYLGALSFGYTLWVPKITSGLKKIASVINAIMFLLWLPALIVSVTSDFDDAFSGELSTLILSLVTGVVLGTIVHEFGHFFATVCYYDKGARVYELGIGIQGFMPMAYNMIDSVNCNKFCKIQILAAGCQMNFIFAGIMGILIRIFPSISSFLGLIMLANLTLGLFNWIIVNGLDGFQIFAHAIGSNPNVFLVTCGKVLFSRKARKNLMNKGVTGFATIVVAAGVNLMQLGYVPILLSIVCEVISWTRIINF